MSLVSYIIFPVHNDSLQTVYCWICYCTQSFSETLRWQSWNSAAVWAADRFVMCIIITRKMKSPTNYLYWMIVSETLWWSHYSILCSRVWKMALLRKIFCKSINSVHFSLFTTRFVASVNFLIIWLWCGKYSVVNSNMSIASFFT